MRKVETVDDIYYLDAELSDPVIKQSYIAQASSDPESFEIIEDEDGSRGVFLRTTTGLYPVGAAEPAQVAPADGTVRPGAMQGEMSAIPQSKFEKILEATGITLEQIGQELDKLGKISIGGIDIGLRDLLPFVGSTEKVQDQRTGEMVTKEVGTPQALQMAGRGESLTTGTGFTTQMKPDVKAAAMDVGLTVAPVAKKAGQVALKAGKKVLDATKDLPVGLSIKDVGAVKLADDLIVDVAPAVRTKNFKNWFGDSKIVDDSGEPLVMYHGTTKDFSEFKVSQTPDDHVPGISVTDESWLASGYAKNIEGANVKPVYIVAKNPIKYPYLEDWAINKARKKGVDIPDENEFSAFDIPPKTLLKWLKEDGYDAIDYRDDPMLGYGLRVFDPRQIKSAIGNVGTFDPKNPSIVRGAAAAPAVPAAMQNEENK